MIALVVQSISGSCQNDGRLAKYYSRASSLLHPCIVQAADMVKSKKNALVNGVTPEMHQSIHWTMNRTISTDWVGNNTKESMALQHASWQKFVLFQSTSASLLEADILLQKKTLVCHSLWRSHVVDQLEKEEIQSSIQNVMWVQMSCVIQMKQRMITVLIVVGRGLSGHIMKEATSIIRTHKIYGRANRQLQSYPQHKLEIWVAWLHEENTPVQQDTTILFSIAYWITEASRSQRHQ